MENLRQGSLDALADDAREASHLEENLLVALRQFSNGGAAANTGNDGGGVNGDDPVLRVGSIDRGLVTCDTCWEECDPRLTYSCRKTTAATCFACLRSDMCSLIQQHAAPLCPARCGDVLPATQLPFSRLVGETMCPFCYAPPQNPDTGEGGFRRACRVEIPCALRHKFCAECARGSAISALAGKHGGALPQCLRSAECKYSFDESSLRQLLEKTEGTSLPEEDSLEETKTTDDWMDAWHDMSLALAQNMHPLTKACNRPDCQGFVMISRETFVSGAAVRSRCHQCEFTHCGTCMTPHHPGKKTCRAAASATRAWSRFLGALAEREGDAGERPVGSGSSKADDGAGPSTTTSVGAAMATAAKAALLRMQQVAATNQYFVQGFREGTMKFCPNEKCKRIIQKTGGCPSMICGKNHDDDKNNQKGCGTKFKWPSVPKAGKADIDAWMQQEADTGITEDVKLDTKTAHLDTSPRELRTSNYRWEPVFCTECEDRIVGTKFECINCGGNSGRKRAILCLGCVCKHLDPTWGRTKHSGHLFSPINPVSGRPRVSACVCEL